MNSVSVSTPSLPWWRHGHVWLLVAGPATVVVAGLVTLWIAVARPDPVLGPERPSVAADERLLPALQGRNHAMTPADDVPQRKP